MANIKLQGSQGGHIREFDNSTTIECVFCGLKTIARWAKTQGFKMTVNGWCCGKAVCADSADKIVVNPIRPTVIQAVHHPENPPRLPTMKVRGLKEKVFVASVEDAKRLILTGVVPAKYEIPIERVFFQGVSGLELIPDESPRVLPHGTKEKEREDEDTGKLPPSGVQVVVNGVRLGGPSDGDDAPEDAGGHEGETAPEEELSAAEGGHRPVDGGVESAPDRPADEGGAPDVVDTRPADEEVPARSAAAALYGERLRARRRSERGWGRPGSPGTPSPDEG